MEVYAVIDEKGRRECRRLGLRVVGSLSIIKRKNGLIAKDEAKEAVKKHPFRVLCNSRFH